MRQTERCHTISETTQMTRMNEFSDLYEFVYKLMNSCLKKLQYKKRDRWGFQPGTNIALAIIAVAAIHLPTDKPMAYFEVNE
jgi:hypothetical protein